MLTVAEARALGVCRICLHPAPSGSSPDWERKLIEVQSPRWTGKGLSYSRFILDYGAEFAHLECLETLTC